MKTDKVVVLAEHLVARAQSNNWGTYDRQTAENLLTEVYREEGDDDPEGATGRFIRAQVK